MSAFPTNENADIRNSAVERPCMAVFWAEPMSVPYAIGEKLKRNFRGAHVLLRGDVEAKAWT
jgi:hypothetical protein